MTLNLKDPKASKSSKRLAEQADVVVENFRPTSRQARHRLSNLRQSIHASSGGISDSDRTVPIISAPALSDRAGMGGLMSVTGAPGEARCGSAFPSPTSRPACLRRRHPHRALGRDVSAKASGCRPRYAGPDLRAGFQAARWLMEKGSPNRPATITRPRSRPACSRPRFLHQYRHDRRTHLGALRAGDPRAELMRPDYAKRPRSKTATPSTR